MRYPIKHRQRSPMTDEQMQQWNRDHPPGSPCFLRLDDGSHIQTTVDSPAWRLSHGDIVARTKARSGGWDLARIEFPPAPPPGNPSELDCR